MRVRRGTSSFKSWTRFAAKSGAHVDEARNLASGSREAHSVPRRYEVASNRDDDWDSSSRLPERSDCWLTVGDDDVRVEMDEFDSQKLEPLRTGVSPSRLDC